MKIGFDLDGTLVENLPYTVYENNDYHAMENVNPLPIMRDYVSRLISMGLAPVIITGRHITAAKPTEVLVKREFGPIPIHYRTHAPFDRQTAVLEKAAHLRHVAPLFYVGDRDDLDREAAAIAKVRYYDVQELIKGLEDEGKFKIC